MNKEYFSKQVSRLEFLIIKWLKPLPHLPKAVSKLLADNIWWVAIAAMILMAFSAFVSLLGVFAYMSFVGNESSVVGIYNTPMYSVAWLVYTIISLVFASLVAYLYYKSITPLKAMRAAGWRLLYLIFLIGIVRAVIYTFTDLNVFMIVFNLIFTAIAYAITAYLLFEIRHYFIKSK